MRNVESYKCNKRFFKLINLFLIFKKRGQKRKSYK